jgi:hypothetical protein
MKLYDATPDSLREYGLDGRDARRLFTAMGTLMQYHPQIVHAGANGSYLEDVITAMRRIIDGHR